jgi:uncharacterized protein (TIGR00251 family)
MIQIQNHPKGITFKIYVQPRSSQNTVAGIHGDALKIKLTAPPVDNAANKMCVKFLARCLDLPKSSIEIISGQTSRSKHILVKLKSGGLTEKTIKMLKNQVESLISAS